MTGLLTTALPLEPPPGPPLEPSRTPPQGWCRAVVSTRSPGVARHEQARNAAAPREVRFQRRDDGHRTAVVLVVGTSRGVCLRNQERPSPTASALRAARAATRAVAALGYGLVILGAVVALVGTTLSGPATPGPPERGAPFPTRPGSDPLKRDPAPISSYVTRSGQSMSLDGRPFRFTGFNLYNAAASDIYSCRSAERLTDAKLDAAMRQVRDAGGTVVRFWAFQSYTAGGTDFTGVDRVLQSARAHGLKAFPVLENQWSDCSRPRAGSLADVRHGTWYAAGYRRPLPGQLVSFLEYARRITAHYRDDPTILAWSLINEAETTRVTENLQSELVGFARDMSEVVRRVDPHHLLTLGTQSNGAPGASGADFIDVYGLAGLDFAEVHDWANRGSDAQPMPGAPDDSLLPGAAECRSTSAPLACSFALARVLDKPVVVAEAGVPAADRVSRATRARQLVAKLDAAFRGGASGYLVWHLNSTNTDGYGVLTGTEDPLYRAMRLARQRWAFDS